MVFFYKMSIAPNIRELIQAKTYEQIICNLMNESSIVFPNKYQWITEQSHGESDFIDITNKQKYDSKILFSKEQCQLIAKGTEHLESWVASVHKEIAEASQKILDRKRVDIRSTMLYGELISRLESVNYDEEAILFIPFPIVPDAQRSVFLQFASDIVSITYDNIVNDIPEKLMGKRTYIIYPSVMDQKIVLRDLTLRNKEYLPIKHISPYITFTLEILPDDSVDNF